MRVIPSISKTDLVTDLTFNPLIISGKITEIKKIEAIEMRC